MPVDVVGLAAGRQRYAFFTNASGGLLDDLMIVRPAPPTRGLRRPVPRRQRRLQGRRPAPPAGTHIGHRCQVVPMPERALLALQGPKAVAALSRLNAGVAPLVFMTGGVFELAGARLLRHALGLHRRRRLRDLGAGRAGRRAGRGAAGAARGQARRPGRARHAAPGSRPVPVRPRHRRDHDARSKPA